MPRHVHIPQSVYLGDLLEYAGLAQCSCGHVALLIDWRAGLWPRRKGDDAYSLMWELAEEWREPEESELATLAADDREILADQLEPRRFEL